MPTTTIEISFHVSPVHTVRTQLSDVYSLNSYHSSVTVFLGVCLDFLLETPTFNSFHSASEALKHAIHCHLTWRLETKLSVVAYNVSRVFRINSVTRADA